MFQEELILRYLEQDCPCATLIYRTLSHRKHPGANRTMYLQNKLPWGCTINIVVEKLKPG